MMKNKKAKSLVSFILSATFAATIILNPLGMLKSKNVSAATPDKMSISSNGLQFIIDREGFSSTCFWDYAQWTIGYGTRCDGSGHPSNPSNLQKGNHTISKDTAKTKFLSVIESTYAPGVRRRLSGLDMNQNQFDALVSLCYNAGEGRLANSPFARYLRGEITKDQAYSDYCSYVITAGGVVNQGLKNRRKLEADLFFSGVSGGVVTPPSTASEGCFQPCGSGYTSIVDALNSIGVDSSFNYRAKIAAANSISNYTGTASQNTTMLNKLKAGILKKPTNSSDNVPNPPAEVDYGTVSYYPKCSSSFTSIVDALKSIGVDSSMTNRKKIATANGISNYSGTADQNTTMLNLLKSGKLKNPNGVSTDSGKYYPACSSSYTSLVDALKSVGVDSSYSYREKIAARNGISGYSGSSSQNTQLLNLLKSGKLIKVGYVEIVNYTITLNANGGTCSTASITVASNSTYKGLINPSREGYTFNGWFTAASGGTQVKDGSALVSKSNHTLYAHWTANTYTVSYDMNDGSGIKSTQKVTYGNTYGSLASVSKNGYTFEGWYTKSVGGTKISTSTKYNTADNVTLYAQWTPKTFTVSFDLNGGSGSVSNKSVEYDNIYGALQDASRTGYTFNGWYTAASGGTKVDANTRVAITSNQTLYAQWSAKSVAVNFYRNLNASDSSKVTETFKYGVSNQKFGYKTDGAGNYSVMNPANIGFGQWSKTGYEMLGWSADKNAGKSTYSTYSGVSDSWINTNSPSTNLYAIWKANTYTVAFNANGGTGTMNDQTMTYDTAANLSANAYSKKGYTFEKWHDGNGNYYADKTSVKNLATSGTKTLWVKWKANTYTVTFNSNGGSCSTANKSVTYDGTYGTLPTPTKTGYAFNGWYTAASDGTKITADTKVAITANQTLYAQWTDNVKPTISSFSASDQSLEGFKLNIKASDAAGIKNVTVDVKCSATNTTKTYTATLSGDSWIVNVKSSDFNNRLGAFYCTAKVTDNNGNTVSSSQLEVKIGVCICKFDANGGTVSLAQKTLVYGERYDRKGLLEDGTLPTPTWAGHKFLGWYTAKTGGTKIENSTIVKTTTDHTLYAHWEGLSITETAITLKNGEQYTIKANQTDLTFKSNNTKVAVVSANGVVTAVGEGNATISVINNNSDVVQLKVTVVSSKIKGDANYDGEVNVADLVMLQNWILGRSDSLTNWKNVDLCEDGRIDVFDMVMLRRILIKQ